MVAAPLQTVPSHCGVIGNEHAGNAARSALQGTNVETIPPSMSDTARKLQVFSQGITLAEECARQPNHSEQSTTPPVGFTAFSEANWTLAGTGHPASLFVAENGFYELIFFYDRNDQLHS